MLRYPDTKKIGNHDPLREIQVLVITIPEVEFFAARQVLFEDADEIIASHGIDYCVEKIPSLIIGSRASELLWFVPTHQA
jgi:hypothetical protein